MWDEIQEQLLEGQTAFDRPDVVCRVFHARLAAYMHNLRSGKYFHHWVVINGVRTKVPLKIEYEVFVVEYQHRGLPHAHIVVRFHGFPSKDDIDACVKWIDENITARRPIITPTSSAADIAYAAKVEKHMIHTCSDGVNGCKDKHGCCKKRFDRTVCQPATTFTEQGYPQYRRDRVEDLHVCQHHRETLEDWDGHAFVEFAGTDQCTLYLYKYIFKGTSKIKMRLTNAGDVLEDDEINLYLRGRYLCSMDCMWRTLGFHTYPSPSPSVLCIDVKLPSVVDNWLAEGKVTTMLIYFERPPCLHHLLYTELFTQYIVYYDLPARFRDADIGVNYFKLNIAGLPPVKVAGALRDRNVFLCKRANSSASITRMAMLYPSVGEAWYLRLILLNRACISFLDARTCQGVVYTNFQLAAVRHGFVQEGEEAEKCFRDSCAFSTPAALRSLFALMTHQGFPTMRIYQDETYRRKMTCDYRGPLPLSGAEKEQMLLKDLHELFAENSYGSLSDFGLPEPTSVDTELQRHQMRYPSAEQAVLLQNLNTSQPNNASQMVAYDDITAAINYIETNPQVCIIFFC